MQAKIVHPFVELVWGTEGEARDKAMFLVEEDLGGTDDDTFDRGVEDNLPGDGIEGHLVVGFVLVEVVLGWGGDGGFVVHHEELVVEVDDSIHVAAEEVGLFVICNKNFTFF